MSNIDDAFVDVEDVSVLVVSYVVDDDDVIVAVDDVLVMVVDV